MESISTSMAFVLNVAAEIKKQILAYWATDLSIQTKVNSTALNGFIPFAQQGMDFNFSFFLEPWYGYLCDATAVAEFKHYLFQVLREHTSFRICSDVTRHHFVHHCCCEIGVGIQGCKKDKLCRERSYACAVFGGSYDCIR